MVEFWLTLWTLDIKVYKTFRRCPGRLVNVFCTFELQPMSKGMEWLQRFSLTRKVYEIETFCCLLFYLPWRNRKNSWSDLFGLGDLDESCENFLKFSMNSRRWKPLENNALEFKFFLPKGIISKGVTWQTNIYRTKYMILSKLLLSIWL